MMQWIPTLFLSRWKCHDITYCGCGAVYVFKDKLQKHLREAGVPKATANNVANGGMFWLEDDNKA